MEDITGKAHELAAVMTAWLTDPDTAPLVADPDTVPASLIEWCRQARDVLAQTGTEGAVRITYTCGTPIAHRSGTCECVTGHVDGLNLPRFGWTPAELAAAKRTDPWGE